MNFSSKEIKRAVRDLEEAFQNILVSGTATLNVRANNFINLYNSNKVINYILKPLFEKDININEIEKDLLNSWKGYLNLPKQEDDQIAYTLQKLKICADNSSFDTYTLKLYKGKYSKSNISDWKNEMLIPCMQKIINKLNDLIEDVVEDNEQVNTSQLQVFNIGNINATNGSNIAVGNEITQSASKSDYKNEIIDQALERKVIEADQVRELKKILTDVQNELSKEKVSESKLCGFVKSLFEVGKKGLLKITRDVIENPQWGDAITSFFLD